MVSSISYIAAIFKDARDVKVITVFQHVVRFVLGYGVTHIERSACIAVVYNNTVLCNEKSLYKFQ